MDANLDANLDSLSIHSNLQTIAEIEYAALLAWPAQEAVALEGWWLRYAQGITRRANSVWPNGSVDAAQLTDYLVRVESFYSQRGLPSRYQISPATQPPQLDATLAERGYTQVATTAVQVCDLPVTLPHSRRENWEIMLTTMPSAAWLATYQAADRVPDAELHVRSQVMQAIPGPVVYALAARQGQPAAVGSAAITAGWLGLFNIATLAAWRRQGAAAAIVQTLLDWGMANGVAHSYLQVMQSNVTAQALYARFGYRTLYAYHYREQGR